TSNMSVDLPTPGSPPNSTSAPATTPPPRTRSNSAIPVDSRGASTPVISLNRMGTESQDGGASAATALTRSSTKVFHCWQEGQWPIHFGDVWPHCWQAYCVLGFTDPSLVDIQQRLEAGELAQKSKFYSSGGAITLLGDHQFGKAGIFFRRFVYLFPIDEHHD